MGVASGGGLRLEEAELCIRRVRVRARGGDRGRLKTGLRIRIRVRVRVRRIMTCLIRRSNPVTVDCDWVEVRPDQHEE